MTIMTAKELAAACEDVARSYKTLYVYGCFGAPMTEKNKARYCNAKNENRIAAIQAASADTFGFDCVNLIKGLLWGWCGDTSQTYGGAVYKSNGVPDTNANGLFNLCQDVSTDFSTILVGEAVWLSGHIGVYIGGGLAVECTPKWDSCVQITAVSNIGAKSGYHSRKWTKHGKIPYVNYEAEEETKVQEGGITVKVSELKKGSKGGQVKALQVLLTGYGYKMEYNGKTYGVDGGFGGATDNAVRAYQKDHSLTVDGIVGPKTWGSLLGLGSTEGGTSL